MKKLRLLAVLALSALLFGCASGAKIENMVYSPAELQTFDKALTKGIKIDSVMGGQSTNPAWTSEISNESFSSAVQQSLTAHNLHGDNGRYLLKISLLDLEQPLIGLDMEVTSRVRYELSDSHNGKALFDETITAPYTATMGDAFVGVERLRLANEGSGRKNIEEFINKLSELNINPEQISVVK